MFDRPLVKAHSTELWKQSPSPAIHWASFATTYPTAITTSPCHSQSRFKSAVSSNAIIITNTTNNSFYARMGGRHRHRRCIHDSDWSNNDAAAYKWLYYILRRFDFARARLLAPQLDIKVGR